MVERFEIVEKAILKMLEDKKYAALRDVLLVMNPSDIAALFSGMEEKQIPLLFRLLPKELAAESFVEMETEAQELLIRSFSDTELKAVLDELYLDDAVDIIEEMPGLVYPTEPSTSVQEESGAAYEENAIEVSESSTEESAESRDEEITQQETTQPLVGMEKESGEGDAYEEEWLPIDYGAAAANGYRVYEIGDGETLYGICLDVYGGLSHLDEICRLNRLENVCWVKDVF